jgi:hypothetical protein
MIIREAQKKAFEEAAAGNFVIELSQHCKEFSPHLTKTLDDDQLNRAVAEGVERAEKHELNWRGPVRFYVDLMIVFGSGFDSDPQYPWISEILGKVEELHQMERMEAIHERSQEYLTSVDGPDNVHTLKALEDLSARMRSGIVFPDQHVGTFTLDLFKQVHPRKYERTGKDALKTLWDESAELGRERFQFKEPRSLALMAIMAFAFGHQFHSDPFLPWISRTLEEKDFDNPEKRAEELERRALTWLDAVLKNAKEGR